MKRFKFRLETVLRHREVLEEQCEQQFAAAQGQVDALAARLVVCQQEVRRVIEGRDEARHGKVLDSAAMLNRERYLETLQQAMNTLEIHLVMARVFAEETRFALVAARQAWEAVTKLREQELSEHTQLALKSEQNTLDEMAMMRYRVANIESKSKSKSELKEAA